MPLPDPHKPQWLLIRALGPFGDAQFNQKTHRLSMIINQKGDSLCSVGYGLVMWRCLSQKREVDSSRTSHTLSTCQDTKESAFLLVQPETSAESSRLSLFQPQQKCFNRCRINFLWTGIEQMSIPSFTAPPNCWVFHLSLPLALTSSCLYLSHALLKFFIPVLPPTPTTTFPFTSLSSRREQKYPVRSSHPWASFTRVQEVGLHHQGQTPPSATLQTQSSPTQSVPAFLLAAVSFLKLHIMKSSSSWWRAALWLKVIFSFFFLPRKDRTMIYPTHQSHSKAPDVLRVREGCCSFTFSLPDTVCEKASKRKPQWQPQKITCINERKWNIFLFCPGTSLILWASGFT